MFGKSTEAEVWDFHSLESLLYQGLGKSPICYGPHSPSLHNEERSELHGL